ncbi:MAG: hypothetical protein HYU64_03840 [Armatimonadetes bacterium]|nr:hypothetical protein [Armatimonadota bacterium]
MDQNNIILGVTVKGLGSKAFLHFVSATGGTDVIADGNIEDGVMDTAQDNFEKRPVITSLYDPKIVEIIKNPENPKVLGKGWRIIDENTPGAKTYMLEGEKDYTSNLVYLSFASNEIGVSLQAPDIYQEVYMQFDPKTAKLFPETIRETLGEYGMS